ncbi:MAG: hypothetical protein JST40_06840 [Armatimonadetes bacterium]|nr:hypothetical protein [Armatimonadota bacterium]
MKILRLTALAAVVGATASAFSAVVFEDHFTTDTSSNYIVKKRNAVSALPLVPLDSHAAFAFDFSVAWPWDGLTYTGTDPGTPIPAAPGETDTKALYIRVNADQLENRSVEAIQVVPKECRLQGDYKLSFYMWYQVTLSGTSTQLGGAGVEHDGGRCFMQADGGSGYFYQFTGEGSSSRDYRLYKGKDEQLLSAGAGGWLTGSQNNTGATWAGYFTKPPFTVVGAPSGQWVKIVMERTGTHVKCSMERTDGGNPGPLPIFDMDDATYVNGYPTFGMFDPAASPRPGDQPLFILIDGVKVEGTLAPVLTGQVALGDWTGSYPSSVDIEMYDSGSNLLKTVTAGIDDNGNYSVPLEGADHARVKYSHWLGRVVNTAGGGTVHANFSLLNGDVDKDDSVTIFDYVTLSDAFDTSVGDALYVSDADLDGDGSITIFDYLVLSTNFDITGDAY